MKKLLLTGLLLPFFCNAMELTPEALRTQINQITAPFHKFFFSREIPYRNDFRNIDIEENHNILHNMNDAIEQLTAIHVNHSFFIQNHPKLLTIIMQSSEALVKVRNYLLMEINFQQGNGEEPPVRPLACARRLFPDND
jgi:hypothetical protein